MFCTAAAPTSLPVAVEARERDLRDRRVARERGAAHAAAGDDVEHAGRHAGLACGSVRRSAVSGVSGDGFSTIVQPAASAGISFHTAIISGKFHGTIAATTPTGSLRV